MERPISNKRQDELDRAPFVRRIADGLIDSKTSRATEVTVGLDGPWGSGKTSILNLLQEEIESRHPKALVVRFDPWLVAGREDLIAEFFAELIRTLKHSSLYKNRVKSLINGLMEYGEYVAPVAALAEPVSGTAIAAASRTWKKFWAGRTKPIGKVRNDLIADLKKSHVPIIVLVDELDRIDDSDVRTMAQLVRAIANLPSISYVLAYDSSRVAQALGGGGDPEKMKRGRAYLEKIVNLEIPVPIATPEEIISRLVADLHSKDELLQLPLYFESNLRFQELLMLLTSDIINTTRDLIKLLAMYEFISNAVRHEVDWVDLLAFCALRIKAPSVAESLKRSPFLFTDEVDTPDVLRSMKWRELAPEKRLAELLTGHSASSGTERLLAFMFPYLNQYSHNRAYNPDSIFRERPLYSALRLSIPSGTISKIALLDLLKRHPVEIANEMGLSKAPHHRDRISYRVSEIYSELDDAQRQNFWSAAAIAVEEFGKIWPISERNIYRPGRHVSEVLFSVLKRDEQLKEHCRTVFFSQIGQVENLLIAHWIRQHIHWHGLFRNDARGIAGNGAFLTVEECKELSLTLSAKWRTQHINGQFFPRHWDLIAVYTMIDTGVWDDKCRELTTELLRDQSTAIGLLFSLYGGSYYSEKSTVNKILDKAELDRTATLLLTRPDLAPDVRSTAMKCLRD